MQENREYWQTKLKLLAFIEFIEAKILKYLHSSRILGSSARYSKLVLFLDEVMFISSTLVVQSPKLVQYGLLNESPWPIHLACAIKLLSACCWIESCVQYGVTKWHNCTAYWCFSAAKWNVAMCFSIKNSLSHAPLLVLQAYLQSRWKC